MILTEDNLILYTFKDVSLDDGVRYLPAVYVECGEEFDNIDLKNQILENQETINQLQYQGFSDLKSWLAEIEVMRDKADKYYNIQDSIESGRSVFMPIEDHEELVEENKQLKETVEKLRQYVSDLENVTPNLSSDKIRFGHSWMIINKLKELLATTEADK